MGVDRDATARAVRDLLRALGYDPDRDAQLRETPASVAEAFARDLLCGREVDLDALVEQGAMARAEGEPSNPIVMRDIDVATLCPHHLLPAHGSATVAYLPGARLLGLGTVARIVDACARQLALQEQIGQRIVEVLMQKVGAQGAYCCLSLWHSCMGIRGARQPRATVRTVATGGVLSGPEGLGQLSAILGHDRL